MESRQISKIAVAGATPRARRGGGGRVNAMQSENAKLRENAR